MIIVFSPWIDQHQNCNIHTFCKSHLTHWFLHQILRKFNKWGPLNSVTHSPVKMSHFLSKAGMGTLYIFLKKLTQKCFTCYSVTSEWLQAPLTQARSFTSSFFLQLCGKHTRECDNFAVNEDYLWEHFVVKLQHSTKTTGRRWTEPLCKIFILESLGLI